MNEKGVYLATITCKCSDCDKLVDVQRYVEQFKPIDPDSCIVRCFQCSTKDRSEDQSAYDDYHQCFPWNQD